MGTISNVQVAGPITVYTAAESEAPPASSIDKGTAWGGAWTDAGFTDGGANFELSGEDADINVDQHLSMINSFPVSEEAKLTVRLAETTLDNILLARGRGSVSTDTAEDSLHIGTRALNTFKAIGVEGRAPGATATEKYRRIILHRARVEKSINIGMTKGDKMMLEVTFVGMIDSTQSAGQEVGVIIDEN
jgi:hypothetical protein